MEENEKRFFAPLIMILTEYAVAAVVGTFASDDCTARVDESRMRCACGSTRLHGELCNEKLVMRTFSHGAVRFISASQMSPFRISMLTFQLVRTMYSNDC